ncbi:MAG: hypothetical protein ACLPSW_01495, partial [Roseiarcus sp.]
MGYFLDAVRFGVSGTPGTAAITVGSAVSGFQLPAAAGAANGQLVPYVIADTGGAWEYGRGTYSSTGPALTRTQIIASSNSGAAINATSAAVVTVTLLMEDLAQGYVATSGGLINKLRNATFDVWQRGAASLTVTTSGQYTADGWFVLPAGASVAVAQATGRSLTVNSLQITG